MDSLTNSMPPQFLRRAATAKFIVDLEFYFASLADQLGGHGAEAGIAKRPAPPDHLALEAVEECRAIAGMLTLARKNKCECRRSTVDTLFAHDH